MATPPMADDNPAAVELDRVARAFRAAIIARESKRAARLSQAYGLAVARVWKSLSASERADSKLPAQARQLLEWAQKTVAADRSLAAEHLEAIRKASHYWKHAQDAGSRGVQVKA
jgi:hypothetical protein